MRALVTGATGYLGFHLCRHLVADGWEVHAIVRAASDPARMAALAPAVTHRLADDPGNIVAVVDAASPDAIFNLAAAMPGDAGAIRRANEALPVALGAALAGRPDAAVVHAASWWEWDERAAEAPANVYAQAKAAGRHALEAAARKHGFRLASLVLHDTYGPADWRGKILDHMLAAAIHGREIPLTPGEQVMDLVHVSDVAAAFRLTADHMAGQPPGMTARYAVATGAPLTLREVARAVEDAAGQPLKARWGARAYRLDTPMRPGPMGPPPPGWAPQISLAEGLAELAVQHRQAAS